MCGAHKNSQAVEKQTIKAVICADYSRIYTAFLRIDTSPVWKQQNITTYLNQQII
tara:strand:- start:484 stop:648 length:165 start_codon:yes stop_codon:yes gene_type:complete